MKKIFEAPYLKVVTVKNNIIATSGGFDETTEQEGYSPIPGGFAPGRGMWDDVED